ncbi:T9SS type A sorting domain-containing protein [Chryseolinea sp. T2]|uniref:T9SS type A sorting domain-containing protein n=1 Tax=Chryseolinea sp. T2 TaxID=3129255 RepID=UPI0030771338
MHRFFLLLFFTGLFFSCYGQLWYEDFSAGTTSGAATGTIGGTWSVTTTPSGGAGSFRANGDRFAINNTDTEGEWSTNTINIASVGYAVIDVSLSREGLLLSNADYIRLYYSLDGGPDVLFAERLGTFFSGSTISGVSAIVAANTVKITIRGMDNSPLGGALYFDDVTVTAAPIIYSRQSGSWTDNSANGTWSLSSHTGAACSCVPLNSQVAIIGNGHTVSLPASQVNIGVPPTTNIAPGAVDVRATGTLQYNTNAVTLDIVQGLFRVRSGGAVNSSSGAITGEQIRFNADVGGANLQIDAGGSATIEDLVIGSNTTNSVYMSGGGDLSVTDDILINADNSTLYNNLTGTLNVNDRLEFQTGVTGAAFVNNQPLTVGTIYFDEDNDTFTNNSTANVGTISSGTGDDNDIFSNTTGSTLNLGSVTTSGQTDIDNSGTINQTGNFTTVVNGSIFVNRGTGTWNWSLTPNTSFDTDVNGALNCTTTGNTFNYNGAGVQSILNTTYYHLNLSNSGNKTPSATVDVNGDLTISDAATLSSAALAVDVEGDVNIQNSGVLGGTGSVNVGGNWNAVNAASYLQGTRTTTFDGTAQTINNASGTEVFYILSLAGSGTKSSTNVFDVDNNLTISGTAQLSITTDLTVGGNWTVTSTNADPFIEGTRKVTFDGSGAQVITTTLGAGETFYNLDITGSGTTSNNSLINITKDLTIAGDATTQLSGSGNINIKGDWNVTNSLSSDPFVEGTRTVSFTGSNPQRLTTALASGETFYNLALNNTSGTIPQITFNSTVTTTRRLDLTSGVVDLNNQIFTLGLAVPANSTSTLARVGGWMYNGSFKRFWPVSTAINTTAGGNFYGLFPVGHSDVGSYRPITIVSTANTSNGTTAGSVTARHAHVDGVTDLTAPGYLESAGVYITRKHNAQFLTEYSGVAFAAATRFTVTATMTGLLNGVTANMRLALSNGANTVTLAGNALAFAGTANSPTVGRSNLQLADLNNKDWRIASTNIGTTPLPVELSSFTARLSNDVVDLNWKTASELNNDFFSVERSADLEEFTPIARVEGSGTTSQPNSYAHVDTTPLYGRSYYRLKQTDFDGEFTYSKVVTVDYSGPRIPSLHVFPNPSDGTTFQIIVNGIRQAQPIPVQVIDSQGLVVYENTFEIESAGVFQEQIRLTGRLKPGIYIVRTGRSFILTQKLIVN